MKKLKYISSVIFLLASVLAACQKEVIRLNKEASEYFPNKVGNYWEYDVYDSSEVRNNPNLPRLYTVKVTITGTQKLADGKDALVWKYEYPDFKREVFVRIIQDSVRVYGQEALSDYRFINFGNTYKIPFTNSQVWNGKLLWIDKYTSNAVSSIISNGITFTDCFLIFHHYEGPNIENYDSFWFKPNIGFLKIYLHQYNLGPLNIECWQLKKYYLL
jgi:hypothetical protein